MKRVVDTRGNQITLTTEQKNALYRRAKELRGQIKETYLTKDELWKPTPVNVEKFRRREGNPEVVKKVEEFRKCMEAIGADPKDIGIHSRRKAR